MGKQLTVLSLSYGVDSFTIAAMVALQELPSIDVALFAEIDYERTETMLFMQTWEPWLIAHGVPVIHVSDKKPIDKALNPGCPQTHVPLFTRNMKSGKPGMLRRTCTHRWKVVPQQRWISAELARRGWKKTPGIVEQWIGFALEEQDRWAPDPVKYIHLRYPLVDMLDPPFTRQECIRWLERHGLEVPVKSACVFCPFQSRQRLESIRTSDYPQDWERACECDELWRMKRPGYECFVLPQRIPLRSLPQQHQLF